MEHLVFKYYLRIHYTLLHSRFIYCNCKIFLEKRIIITIFNADWKFSASVEVLSDDLLRHAEDFIDLVEALETHQGQTGKPEEGVEWIGLE